MQRDPALRRRIEAQLHAFPVQALTVERRQVAAVAVVITDEGFGADLPGMAQHRSWRHEAALLLTRRAAALRHHAGQWALPGGRVEPGESAEQAALRELFEEVGLQLDEAAVLGRLDDYATRSGFVITPVVVWAGAARQARPNPDEVQSIHRIPVHEFQRADAPLLEALPGHAHPVLRMPVAASWIAAPTAAVLYQFREVCIEARTTRVAHFEQPEFAWR